MTLTIDEVFTAKCIEHSNETFVEVTEEGEPAKTVLAFMVKSICSLLSPNQRLSNLSIRCNKIVN